jgi:hypothetical protein
MTDAQSFLITVTSNLTSSYLVLQPAGSTWRYLDTGVEPSSSWKNTTFNDNSWKTGQGLFGYGTGAEATQLAFGPNAGAKYVTTYFRRLFVVPDASKVLSLDARLLRNDGAVIYLNGAEIWRDNMPSGVISNQSLALSAVTGAGPAIEINRSLNPSLLLDGTNCLAVELHQSAPDGADVAFDLELKGFATTPVQMPLQIVRSNQLLTTTNLASPSVWTRATNSPAFSNGQWSIQIPISGNDAQFFKLQLP